VLSGKLDAFAFELHSLLTLGEAPGAGRPASAPPTVVPLQAVAA
jgi:biopolymer transport protein ExbB